MENDYKNARMLLSLGWKVVLLHQGKHFNKLETNKNIFVCQYLFELLELNIEIKQLYVCY